MPMDQADQDAMEAMFDTNNKRKKIQDIPTFYGSAKDTISGRYLIERVVYIFLSFPSVGITH